MDAKIKCMQLFTNVAKQHQHRKINVMTGFNADIEILKKFWSQAFS